MPSVLTTVVTLPTITVQLYQTIFSPKRGYVREKRAFVVATLDSGSNINCLSRKLAAEVGFVATEDGTTFRTSNGQSAKTRGSCRLGLFKDSGTRVMDLPFQIVDDLPVDVLLGVPFLQHVVLDMPSRKVTLRLEGQEVVWSIEDEIGEELLSSVVKARKDLMIDAQRREEHELEAKLFEIELPGGVPLDPAVDRDVLGDFRLSALAFGRHDHGDGVLVTELVEGLDGDNGCQGTIPDSEELKEMLQGLCPEDDEWKNIKFQSELSDSQERRFKRIIAQNSKVYQTPKSPEESLYRGWNAKPLDVKLCSDKYSRPKRLPMIPLQLKESWDKQIAKWEADGIVEQQTKAVPFLSPFVPVPKKDGSIRWTFDTRLVNRMIEWENVALPPVETVVAKMSRFKYVMALDFQAFYLSFGVTEATADLLTFIDPSTSRSMRFRRSPFGMRGSASHSVQQTNELLSKLPFFNDRMALYIDDIFVGANSVDQCLDDLEKILAMIAPTNLRLKPSKCKIGQTKSVIFGYEVQLGEYRVAQNRIKALTDLPAPKTKRDLQKYFGSFSYFRASLPFKSSMAYHQTQFAELLKKDSIFVWNEEYQKKFEDLKMALSNSITRTAPLPGEKLNLRVDASKFFVGFLLSVTRADGEKIVTTGSRKWPPNFIKYDACRLELIALLTSLRMLRHMLIGHMVAVWTDNPYTFFILKNRNLVLIEEPQIISRLLNEVSRLNFQIHKASNENPEWYIVDRLSRAGHKWIISHRNIDEILAPTTSMDVTMLSAVSQYDVEEVAFTTFSTQTVLKDLMEFKKVVSKIHESASFKENGTAPEELQDEVIARTHALAHLGSPRLIAVLNQVNVHFENRRSKIADWIRRCHVCSTTKSNNRPLNIQGSVYNSSRPGDITCFDINSIGLGQNAIHILVAVDQHTEYCMPYKLPPVPSAVNVLRAALLHLVRLAPCCHTVRVDNGAVFKSHLFQDTMTELGIKVSFTSRLNSRSNSLVERKNKEINSSLRLMRSIPSGRHFDVDLATCALKINMVPHAKYRISPYELYFGNDVIGDHRYDFNSPEEAWLRIQNLQGLREVIGLFKGNPVPNSARYVDVGDLVRLATTQKLGSNKIARLTFTESIFKIVDADHQRQTFKVMELNDSGDIKNPDSKAIISHLRHLRLVQKSPERLGKEQDARLKSADQGDLDDEEVHPEAVLNDGGDTNAGRQAHPEVIVNDDKVDTNAGKQANPEVIVKDDGDGIKVVDVIKDEIVGGKSFKNGGDTEAVRGGNACVNDNPYANTSSCEKCNSVRDSNLHDHNSKKRNVDTDKVVAGQSKVAGPSSKATGKGIQGKKPSGKNSKNSGKNSKNSERNSKNFPKKAKDEGTAVRSATVKKDQKKRTDNGDINRDGVRRQDVTSSNDEYDHEVPRRSNRNRQVVKGHQSVRIKDKVKTKGNAGATVVEGHPDVNVSNADEDLHGPRRSARIQQATESRKNGQEQKNVKNHLNGNDGDGCAIRNNQGRRVNSKSGSGRPFHYKSKKKYGNSTKKRQKCQLCLMIQCHRGCVLGPE